MMGLPAARISSSRCWHSAALPPETVVTPRLDRSVRSSMRDVSRLIVFRAMAYAPRAFDLV
jgi:hypothetical protein